MPQHAFKFGEMFPADDVLAEWMATLANRGRYRARGTTSATRALCWFA